MLNIKTTSDQECIRNVQADVKRFLDAASVGRRILTFDSIPDTSVPLYTTDDADVDAIWCHDLSKCVLIKSCGKKDGLNEFLVPTIDIQRIFRIPRDPFGRIDARCLIRDIRSSILFTEEKIVENLFANSATISNSTTSANINNLTTQTPISLDKLIEKTKGMLGGKHPESKIYMNIILDLSADRDKISIPGFTHSTSDVINNATVGYYKEARIYSSRFKQIYVCYDLYDAGIFAQMQELKVEQINLDTVLVSEKIGVALTRFREIARFVR